MLSGLIGAGIGLSLSPQLHEVEARACGIDLEYRLHDLPIDTSVDGLGRCLKQIEAEGGVGINVTHPFKRKVIELLDEVSPDAKAIGSVNTIALRDGRRIGHNTDWSGFLDSLARDLPGADLEGVAQIGAGGAGAATAYGLLRAGANSLYINDLNVDLARQLIDHLRGLFPDRAIELSLDAEATLKAVRGIVQASPIGMTGHDGLPVPPQYIQPEHWVIDIIYQPRETALLRCARERGCRATNGLGMVVAQAALAFQIITGVAPDLDRMRSNLRAIA